MLSGIDQPSASMGAGKEQPTGGLLGNNPMPKTFVSFYGAADSGQRILAGYITGVF